MKLTLHRVAATAVVALSACSGQSHLTPTTNGMQNIPVSFAITVPKAPMGAAGTKPNFVSPSTQSAAITVNGGTPVVVNCISVCSGTISAPVGTDTFAASLYGSPNGVGSVLSQGSIVSTIVAGQANSVTIAFDGLVRSISFSINLSALKTGTPSTQALAFIAKDAAGNTITGANAFAAPITLVNSDTTGAVTLSQNTLTSPISTISLTYNGSATYTGSTITAMLSGATIGSLSVPQPALCSGIPAAVHGYIPCDLWSAYGLFSESGGVGQTIAIIDAYDDPNAESDLAAYRNQFRLPSCTTANGCFRKLDEHGGTTYPTTDSTGGWENEESLDLDMASAICPNCHIILIEAATPASSDLYTGVQAAVRAGATEVSMSFGGPESGSVYAGSPEQFYDQNVFLAANVPITASAGDNAYQAGTSYPASSQYVTAVGGTSLTTANNTRGWSEAVWENSSTQGTGSGCSALVPKPAWQVDSGCSNRMVADISAVADPYTGVAVYDTFAPSSGWLQIGGTSASAPIIASIYALSNNPGATRYGSFPYSHASALNDIVVGANGSCAVAYFCSAEIGYDGPTGLGTPIGTAAFGGPTPAAIHAAAISKAVIRKDISFLSRSHAASRACAPATRPGIVSCMAVVVR